MDQNLLALLRRENPWLERAEIWPAAVASRLPGAYIPRAKPTLASFESEKGLRRKATLVVGPRQAGKSTWIWKQIEGLSPRVLFVNCELRRFREWCSDPGAFLSDLPGIVRDPALIFLEEAQHLDEAALIVKGLVDRGLPCPLVVTGSSGFHLRSRTRESLAGRARRVRLLPLSLEEVCHDLPTEAPLLDSQLRRERFERHAVVGGYPAAWQAARPDGELSALVEAFVLRDASDLYRIERPDAFRTLLMLVARQVGSPVNLSEWASITGISVPTVSAYLEIMEESHLVVRVPVHVGGKRAELTSRPKIYFVDCGLRNCLAGGFAPLAERMDVGAVVENWVFSELYKSLPLAATVAWWRTKSGAEVDFVVREGDSLIGIEVKAASEGRPSLSRGARSFLEAYRPSHFFVATRGIEHEARIGACRIQWVHAMELQAHLRELLGKRLP